MLVSKGDPVTCRPAWTDNPQGYVSCQGQDWVGFRRGIPGGKHLAMAKHVVDKIMLQKHVGNMEILKKKNTNCWMGWYNQPTVGLLYMLLHVTTCYYTTVYVTIYIYTCYCMYLYLYVCILYEPFWANQSLLGGWQRVNMTQLGRPQAIEEEGWKGQTRPGQLDRITHKKSWTKRTNQYHSNSE